MSLCRLAYCEFGWAGDMRIAPASAAAATLWNKISDATQQNTAEKGEHVFAHASVGHHFLEWPSLANGAYSSAAHTSFFSCNFPKLAVALKFEQLRFLPPYSTLYVLKHSQCWANLGRSLQGNLYGIKKVCFNSISQITVKTKPLFWGMLCIECDTKTGVLHFFSR